MPTSGTKTLDKLCEIFITVVPFWIILLNIIRLFKNILILTTIYHSFIIVVTSCVSFVILKRLATSIIESLSLGRNYRASADQRNIKMDCRNACSASADLLEMFLMCTGRLACQKDTLNLFLTVWWNITLLINMFISILWSW